MKLSFHVTIKSERSRIAIKGSNLCTKGILSETYNDVTPRKADKEQTDICG